MYQILFLNGQIIFFGIVIKLHYKAQFKAKQNTQKFITSKTEI